MTGLLHCQAKCVYVVPLSFHALQGKHATLYDGQVAEDLLPTRNFDAATAAAGRSSVPLLTPVVTGACEFVKSKHRRELRGSTTGAASLPTERSQLFRVLCAVLSSLPAQLVTGILCCRAQSYCFFLGCSCACLPRCLLVCPRVC